MSLASSPSSVSWADPARASLFDAWMASVAPRHGLQPDTLQIASADASFRRYLRIQGAAGQPSRIIMDAPPEKENCHPFVHVARLMEEAGLHAPRVLEWDETNGFMLLTDLGDATMMSALDPEQHQVLQSTFDLIVQRNLAAPQVYVHRDFMPRNLMLGDAPGKPLGVLDFQDAVYGPITYDIASLMRDAFISWDEDLVLDVTIRYWERARKAGLMDFEDWHADFGAFYRAVEWMALQRHLKVAGIFARLTLRDGKEKYLADAPRFIHYIRSTARRYRELAPLLKLVDDIEGTQDVTGYAFGRV